MLRALLLVAIAVTLSGRDAVADPLSYNRDVRPILVEHCFACHGADSASRQASLRLDRRDDAIDHGAIVPGDADSSPVLDRVYSDDPEEVMPPPRVKKPLTAAQKEVLRRWIAAGAAYEPHWSFIPPQRPEPPAVKDAGWVRNPIDRFILARLEAEGLAAAPEADRRRLARRVAVRRSSRASRLPHRPLPMLPAASICRSALTVRRVKRNACSARRGRDPVTS